MTQIIPDIVAPWGSYNKAMVASLNWADSVYVWVPFTSLRMRQNKVRTFDDLKKTISDLHANGTKAYLTMNIFPRNTDIKVFEGVVEQLADCWADAVIFSDPGTFNVIRKYMPDMPLHLSTQTSILNKEAVKFWYDLWVKRIVLARELHINEIKEIKEFVPDMEIEVFVHWAMCVTYSGRCLMGEYFSWRDGNKWECSHVCRYKFKVYLEEEKRPWKLFQLKEDEGGSYMMSSKDLCTIERLWEIMPYVDALKIEWRSKSEFYVWSTVKAYKHVRDSILNWTMIEDSIKNLVYEIPHRYYWDGFLFNDIRSAPDGEETPEDYDMNQAEIEKVSNEQLGEIAADSNTKQDDLMGETVQNITKDTAGPVAQRQYMWFIAPETMEKDGKIYYAFTAKDNTYRGDEYRYLAPESLGLVKVVDIIDGDGNELEKWHCNKDKVYINFDKDLGWYVCLYK